MCSRAPPSERYFQGEGSRGQIRLKTFLGNKFLNKINDKINLEGM